MPFINAKMVSGVSFLASILRKDNNERFQHKERKLITFLQI